MADNYTGSYAGITKGGQITAQDMADALNQMEKVSNKQDTINDSSSEYPSSKAVYALAESLRSLEFLYSCPKGMIMMTNGTWINGYKGWYICNGENGTPDLRDKFMRGADDNTKNQFYINSVTGNTQRITVPLPYHAHEKGTLAIKEDGNHAHSFTGYNESGGASNICGVASGNIDRKEDSAGAVDAGGTHSHNIEGDISYAGTNDASIEVNVMPSYYTLVYIIKMY